MPHLVQSNSPPPLSCFDLWSALPRDSIFRHFSHVVSPFVNSPTWFHVSSVLRESDFSQFSYVIQTFVSSPTWFDLSLVLPGSSIMAKTFPALGRRKISSRWNNFLQTLSVFDQLSMMVQYFFFFISTLIHCLKSYNRLSHNPHPPTPTSPFTSSLTPPTPYLIVSPQTWFCDKV